jgi:hypothetical protein
VHDCCQELTVALDRSHDSIDAPRIQFASIAVDVDVGTNRTSAPDQQLRAWVAKQALSTLL